MEELFIEFGICKLYQEETIEKILTETLMPVEEARKKSQGKLGENFCEIEFQLARVYSKLGLVRGFLKSKKIKEKEEDIQKLAKFLIETANELASIEGVKSYENDK